MVGDATVLAVVEALRRESSGAGPLDVLLTEPGITDVLVNGPDRVYVDRGRGLERVGIRVGATTVRTLPSGARHGPAPRRSGPTWTESLRAQAEDLIRGCYAREYGARLGDLPRTLVVAREGDGRAIQVGRGGRP